MSSRELVSDLRNLTGKENLTGRPASAGKTLKYHELPSSVRDSIPRLTFSMLLYSGKSDERRVNINGSRLQEGQEVSPGLKLEEITPDGAIFSYGGQRFYKGVIGD